ncbi:hypothetical protein DH2020_014757 [Rehmannia glutinosa]|uniref:Uncharacterized protein n=1 Tax=Rehmannia glutinosa TaxID=99300 RepID=A0ABR0WXG4_REHGL
MNEASILASLLDLEEISKGEIYDALERVIVTSEKKNVVISCENKRLVAYHVRSICQDLRRSFLITKWVGLSRCFAPSEERLKSGLCTKAI